MTSSTSPVVIPEPPQPSALSAAEQECLKCIAGHMIPASVEFGMPGADDPAIFSDILASVRRDKQALSRTLGLVDQAAGGRLADLPPSERSQLLGRLRAREPGLFGVVEAIISLSYYRDDRVVQSIGMEARPPYPDGYVIGQGDWSLLQPVRRRSAMYRDAG